jgi:hypothetical protein
MSTKQSLPIGMVLVILIATATVALWQRWPVPLQAQDDPTLTDQPQLFLPLILAPTGAGEQDSVNDGHDHDDAVPLRDSWPPQPVGITAVRWLADDAGAAVAAAESQHVAAAAIALASPLVQAALGDVYVHAATIQPHAKAAATAAGKEAAPIRVAYFSYSNNVTVEATVRAGKVATVQRMAAATYQPEPTRQERVRAIELARAYFLAQGQNRVNQLRGFVIMAYRSQGATGFYDSRVLYVTFHETLDERPEYLAWVDLRNETILKAVVETFEQPATVAVATETATNQPVEEGQ